MAKELANPEPIEDTLYCRTTMRRYRNASRAAREAWCWLRPRGEAILSLDGGVTVKCAFVCVLYNTVSACVVRLCATVRRGGAAGFGEGGQQEIAIQTVTLHPREGRYSLARSPDHWVRTKEDQDELTENR